MEFLHLLATFNTSDWGLWEWLTTIASAITFIPFIIFVAVGTVYKTAKSFIDRFIKK